MSTKKTTKKKTGTKKKPVPRKITNKVEKKIKDVLADAFDLPKQKPITEAYRIQKGSKPDYMVGQIGKAFFRICFDNGTFSNRCEIECYDFDNVNDASTMMHTYIRQTKKINFNKAKEFIEKYKAIGKRPNSNLNMDMQITKRINELVK